MSEHPTAAAAGAPEPALRLQGLRQSYPIRLGLARREVLSGVDLELARGATLGLVGPNGSGKSTLMRTLAGIDAPRGGSVRVLGGAPTDAGVRRRVGFLPEDSPFPPELTARGVLALLGSVYGMPRARARERGDELLRRVGLADDAKKRLGRFSRGMSRRFGLAQAFLHGPDLVLLDEPTAGLDAPGFAVLDDLLAEARRDGATVVLCSHLLDDVHRHCDRLAVIVGGRLALQGDPTEVLGRAGEAARVEVELSGLGPGGLESIRGDVESLGGTWHGARPAQANLLALYRELARGPAR